jgi:hypothetical protein
MHLTSKWWDIHCESDCRWSIYSNKLMIEKWCWVNRSVKETAGEESIPGFFRILINPASTFQLNNMNKIISSHDCYILQLQQAHLIFFLVEINKFHLLLWLLSPSTLTSTVSLSSHRDMRLSLTDCSSIAFTSPLSYSRFSNYSTIKIN